MEERKALYVRQDYYKEQEEETKRRREIKKRWKTHKRARQDAGEDSSEARDNAYHRDLNGEDKWESLGIGEWDECQEDDCYYKAHPKRGPPELHRLRFKSDMEAVCEVCMNNFYRDAEYDKSQFESSSENGV